MKDVNNRVTLNICVQDKSVRLYGNREFFRFLRNELDHLIDCPDKGYCEFQTVSLAAKPPGLPKKPHMKVYRLPDNADDLSSAVDLDPGDFDVVFMTVEDEDLR